jgi:hypothetical protein
MFDESKRRPLYLVENFSAPRHDNSAHDIKD